MSREEQVKICQTPQKRYWDAMADAAERLNRGEQQFFCTVCNKWKWADELCEFAEIEEVR